MIREISKPKYFGPFEILDKIGRGSTAVVYKAKAPSRDGFVAVKMGAKMLSLDDSNFERFRREFTIIRHISHPNLVRALDFGEVRNVPFLVLEYVEGQTLEARVRDHGPLPVYDAINVILQIASGLRELHRNRILHHDIKPGNTFLTADGQAKLGDFGLLKTLTSDADITGTRQSMGTVEFGAPEQFEDARGVGVRCDIYSLATTFFAAVTGLYPFGAGGMRRILQRKLKNKFIPLRCMLPAIPSELDDLICRSVNADKRLRPASVDEFIEQMTSVRDQIAQWTPAPDSSEVPSPRAGSASDRRGAARIAVKLPAAFVPFHQNKRSSFAATILDVSHGGMCLQANTLTPNNTLLEITAADTGATYLAQVRWAKPLPDQSFILGCSFVTPPELDEIARISPLLSDEDLAIDVPGNVAGEPATSQFAETV